MVNFTELSEYDLKSALLSADNNEAIILQKVLLAYRKFNSNLSGVMDHFIACEKEFSEQFKANCQSSSELNENITVAKKKLETTIFNQKVSERETNNIIKLIEERNENLKDAKEIKDLTALEIVDLERELEERKKEKKKDWDSIKRGCSVYKEKLDIRLKVELLNDLEKVTVSFFVSDNDDEYHVNLTHKNKIWKVDKIQPDLEAKHRKDLSTLVDFSEDSQVKDIRAFLCQLRRIFLKYCNK